MTTSARENIVAYLATLLGALTGITVYRSREAAVARAEGAVLVIKPQDEQVINQSEFTSLREFSLSFQLIVRGDIPDNVADPYLVAIQAAIQNDPTLGGRAARSIERSTRWDFEVADMTGLVVEMVYLIKYLTPVGSISTLA